MTEKMADDQETRDGVRSPSSEGTPLVPKEDMEEEVELSDCGASLPCNPRRYMHRYIVLIFMCLLSFGSYFCYDNPAAMQDTMMADLSLNTEQFMMFYSMYSYPNIVLAFIGGYLIDKVFGVRLGAIIFAGFCLLGQLLFATGAYIENGYILMCIGRFVFGIGGESLAVAQNTYAVGWFKGKELNMVFGLQLSLARIGSTVNMNVMQPLYDAIYKSDSDRETHETLGITLYLGMLTCLFSLCCALAMAFFDWRAKKVLGKSASTTGETITLKDLKVLMINGKLWIVCIICVMYYVTVFPFIGLGLVFFEMKFGMAHAQASVVNSLVYILSAVCSPLLGFLIDKSGKNIFWLMTGILITLGCHGLLAFTFASPYIAMIFMGVAYSVLAASLWPLVSYFIPDNQLGTAYGLMQSVQNAGLAAVSQVSGSLVDSKGYLILITFYLVCLCVAMIFTVILYLVDAATNTGLNLSAKTRAKMAEIKDKEGKLN
ncbi:lysosomal dipeptide transporter MFSD1-like [Watersipora subatra]|uniref:lysosomal dipeptide transporter MFSD1-like n=1 Tax=Watersipora subatra TaxID=2589382 RepID=UPI00355BE3E4